MKLLMIFMKKDIKYPVMTFLLEQDANHHDKNYKAARQKHFSKAGP